DAPNQGRSAPATQLQRADSAGEVSEWRDVDLPTAHAHEPVAGQGRPGEGLSAVDLRVPRRAAEVQRRPRGEVQEGKEEGARESEEGQGDGRGARQGRRAAEAGRPVASPRSAPLTSWGD